MSINIDKCKRNDKCKKIEKNENSSCIFQMIHV